MSYKNSKWKELRSDTKSESIRIRITEAQKQKWESWVDEFGKVSKLVDYIFENFEKWKSKK